MTYSACWIEPVDDDEFARKMEQWDAEGRRPYMLGAPARPYWITELISWANANGLQLHDRGSLETYVEVSRTEIVEFVSRVTARHPPVLLSRTGDLALFARVLGRPGQVQKLPFVQVRPQNRALSFLLWRRGRAWVRSRLQLDKNLARFTRTAVPLRCPVIQFDVNLRGFFSGGSR